MALGARPLSVVQMILGGGMSLVAIGIALGLAAAIGLTRLVRAMLFDVAPFDPMSYVVTAAILLLVAVVACVIPARRAMRVDPIVAMLGD
jgi:ABC-type antimicrobial peptide transport system permease subunit